MTRHLLKLVWNRRGANALVAVEMLVSFLVLLGVSTMAVSYANNLRQPIGFEYRNVLRLEMDGRGPAEGPDARETARQLLLALRSVPGVEAVAAANPAPFSQSSRTRDYERNGRRVGYRAARATDDTAAVLGIRITRGRFFTREDDAATWEPVVINERLAQELFGTEDPIGRDIGEMRRGGGTDGAPPGAPPEPERRVVGVMSAFRQEGEFDNPDNYVLERMRLDVAPALGGEGAEPRAVGDVLVRVAPGSTAELEQRILDTARAVARGWTLRLEPLPVARDRVSRFYLAPVMIVGLVAAFLAIMVALGLTGVLWLAVTRRTREIGLRRAKGATRGDIRRQILGEILVLTTLAILPGVILALQLPLVGALPVPGGVFALSLALSVAGIYLLAVLCGFYPARLAVRVEPTEALRYE
ncbi:MAG: FtsX-like permease family protein [Vicinamibacteria bacterium]